MFYRFADDFMHFEREMRGTTEEIDDEKIKCYEKDLPPMPVSR